MVRFHKMLMASIFQGGNERMDYLSNLNIIWIGFMASLAAGLATGVGSLPVFFVRDISKKVMDALLGGAAGSTAPVSF